MKNYKLKLMALAILTLSLSFSSCKKGDTGPAGAQGANGKDGNANVKNLTVFVNANEWINKSGESEVTKLVPEITADIVSKGAVMVYMEGSGSGSWEALPTSSADASGLVLTIGYAIEAGKLHLMVTFNDNITLPNGTLESSNFKIVLVAGSARSANPNMNLQNYNEVKTTYNFTN